MLLNDCYYFKSNASDVGARSAMMLIFKYILPVFFKILRLFNITNHIVHRRSCIGYVNGIDQILDIYHITRS